MSSLPGHSMEDYICWAHDLIADGYEDCNISLYMAECLGNQTRRIRISPEMLLHFVELYEPYRWRIELALDNYDEDNSSWRDYASYAFSFIPASIDLKAEEIRQQCKAVTE